MRPYRLPTVTQAVMEPNVSHDYYGYHARECRNWSFTQVPSRGALMLSRARTVSTLVVLLGAFHCTPTPTDLELETWTAVPDLTIGSLDDGPTAFSGIADVEIGRNGEIYVLEQGAHEVRVFGSDGSFLRRFGRIGEGPGEFRSFGAAGWKGDTLWIEDPSAARITLFARDRPVARTLSYRVTNEVSGAVIYMVPGPLLADGSVFARSQISSRTLAGGGNIVPSYQTDRSGEILRVLATVDFGNMILLWGETGASTSRQPFSDQQLLAVAKDGRSVWRLERPAARSENAAHMTLTQVSLAGDIVFRSMIPYRPIPLTAELFRRIIQDEVISELEDVEYPQARIRMLREAYETRGYQPDYIPPASDLVAGTDGTVWVRREDLRADSVAWLVLDSDGRPTAAVTLPSDVKVRRATRTMIWGVRPGEFDEPYVVRFRLENSGTVPTVQ